MSYNGSGTFVINTSGQPVVPNTVISATTFNALTNDLANGLSTCITKDGQTTPTANIPMGNNKITGLAPGTSGTDAANLSQVQGSTAKLLQSVTGTDTITAAMVPALTSYSAGQMFYFVAAGDNTGAVTINIDSLGAKSVTRDGSTALVAGDIVSGEVALIVYDGTRFQLLNGNSFTNLNVSNNLTLSGGTANGVLYLNGSKVATSGSALVFDGTNLGIGTASPTQKLDVQGSATDFVSFNGLNTNNSAGTITSSAIKFGFTSTVGTHYATLKITEDSVNSNSGGLTISLPNGGVESPLLTLTSAGNLGLGVTPSAWADYKAIQTTGASFIGYSDGASNNQAQVTANAFFTTGSAWKYIYTDHASRYMQFDGEHRWYTAPSGTAGNAISFTQAMTLDASSNLSVATTSTYSAYAKLHVLNGLVTATNATDGGVYIGATTGGTEIGYLSIGRSYNLAASGDTVLSTSAAKPLIFGTNNTERGRFTAGGYFKASNDGTYLNSTASYHELRTNDDNDNVVRLSHTGSLPYGIDVQFTGAAPDNNTNFFLRCEDTGAVRCYIYSDGDLANHDGVYGTISDERLKQDIVDAGSQWDDLKSIRFRKYRMKTDVEANPDAPAMFGVVAQELAQVCPGLVDEHPNMKTVEVTDEEGNVTQTQEPDGTTTMTVKSSILLMKAAKALQEAMARIESLEAKVAALEAQ